MALVYTPVKFGSYNGVEGVEVTAHSAHSDPGTFWEGMTIAVCKPNP